MRRGVGAFVAAAASVGLVAAAKAPSAPPVAAPEPGFMPRLEASTLAASRTETVPGYSLFIAPATLPGGASANLQSARELGGRLQRFTYTVGAGTSAADLYGHYIFTLGKAGFQTLFQCQGVACGGRAFNQAIAADDPLFTGLEAEQRYLAARLPRAEGDLYVVVYVSAPPADATAAVSSSDSAAVARLDVLTTEHEELAPVSFTTSYGIKTGLDAEGHVALYDLAFDPGSPTLPLGGRPAVQKIAQFLQENPSLGLLIVSHTAGDLGPERGLALSKQRAQEVVNALVSEFGVAASRISAQGLGMAAPLATNATIAGRKLNERIEVVLR